MKYMENDHFSDFLWGCLVDLFLFLVGRFSWHKFHIFFYFNSYVQVMIAPGFLHNSGLIEICLDALMPYKSRIRYQTFQITIFNLERFSAESG